MPILLLVAMALRQDAIYAGQAEEFVRASATGTSLDARMDPPNGLALGTSPYGRGAARVCFFRRTPSGWVQEQTLEIAAAIDGRPGSSALASDGDRVYVGTPYDDRGGTVHVLARDGGRWARRTAWSLAAGEGSRFGLALAAPGGSLLVSCRRPRPTGAPPSCAGILDVSRNVVDL
jgi:hypothetical protein